MDQNSQGAQSQPGLKSSGGLSAQTQPASPSKITKQNSLKHKTTHNNSITSHHSPHSTRNSTSGLIQHHNDNLINDLNNNTSNNLNKSQTINNSKSAEG